MTTPLPPGPGPQPSEPAWKVGTITAVVGIVLALALEFGIDISDRRQALILTAAVILAPLAQAAWTRRKVWSPQSVAELVQRLRRPERLS